MSVFDNTIILTGKHAFYSDKLKELDFFNRIIDVYINASVVGFIYNRKSKKDKSSEYKDVEKKIFLETVTKELDSLEFTYRLILLSDSSETLSFDERVNRAFRDDSLKDENNKRHAENFDLFNSYVRGGIEILYEKIASKGHTDMDFIKNSFDFMKELEVSTNKNSSDDFLNSLE